MNKKHNFRLLILLFVLISTDCGYNLRTHNDIFADHSLLLIYDSNDINQQLIEELNKFKLKSLFLNKISTKADITIKILEQSLTKYSLALNDGMRTNEARLEYSIEYSIKTPNSPKESHFRIVYEKSSPYSESKILATESEDELILREFISRALKSISLSAKQLTNKQL